jgi:gas vesicle protein
MNNASKVVLGLAAAATVGAAIGMLLAPEKGTDMQQRIRTGANQLLKEINELIATGKDVINQNIGDQTESADKERKTPVSEV